MFLIVLSYPETIFLQPYLPEEQIVSIFQKSKLWQMQFKKVSATNPLKKDSVKQSYDNNFQFGKCNAKKYLLLCHHIILFYFNQKHDLRVINQCAQANTSKRYLISHK